MYGLKGAVKAISVNCCAVTICDAGGMFFAGYVCLSDRGNFLMFVLMLELIV